MREKVSSRPERATVLSRLEVNLCIGKTMKRRASEAELEPSGPERYIVKRTQQSRTAMQELESTEGSDMAFELLYNRHLVVQLADYAAEPTMFSSFSCNHTMGFTVTGSMHDVRNPVYEYSDSVYPIQAEGYDFADGKKAESKREVAVNLSWRDMSRPYEKGLLSGILAIDRSVRQKAILQDNKAYKAERPLEGYPVLMLLTKYEPISTTTSMREIEHLNAFLALIYCHAMLWSIGIEHGDISEENLMFDKTTKNPKLCDYDLSHVRGQARPSGYSNSGTWAFMATELLTRDAMDGLVPRLYRHDFESFIAVLVWVVFRYRDGKPVPDPPLEEWVQDHFVCCAANRKHTFDQIAEGSLAGPTWMTGRMWSVITRAVSGLQYLLARSQSLASSITCMELKAEKGSNKGELGSVDATVDDEFVTIPKKKPDGDSLAIQAMKEELDRYSGLMFLDKVFEELPLFDLLKSRGPFFADLLRTHIDDLKKPSVS
ncbi:hypothetical protein D9611_008196 [Ephemerocybe angulata]|uniref:Protein kinase domain-containing protein n=1 Tax=Ephemerocybe angulata TaxID=980116 RepID=A0A8H5BZ76_9AGAR|nr:hypothetical protein D9611_008196 [Tulosesus angulatus]